LNYDLSTSWKSFLIIFRIFWILTFDLLKRLFSSFFRFFEILPLQLLKRLFSSFF
jgi:hypothetical protein